LQVMATMMTTTIPVDSKSSNKRKMAMMNQPEEEEDESTALLAAVADGGRSCFTCRVMKKRVDFPRSLRKIQTECRACLSFRSSGSIETREEESADPESVDSESSAAEKYLKQCHYQEQQQKHYHHYQQTKPQFVLIPGAEIV
jgi:hypothetical protein